MTTRRVYQGAILLAALMILAGGTYLIVTGSRPTTVSRSAPAPTPAEPFLYTSVADPLTAAIPTINTSRNLAHTVNHSPALPPPPGAANRQRPQQPAEPLLDERLVIPALGVNASILTYPLTNGSLVLPERVDALTRWDGSAPINSRNGTILVAGHVDNRTQGPGVLYWLHSMQPGDALYLTHEGHVTRWKTTSLHSYPKQALPSQVWVGPAGSRTLIVVTCGGAFQDGHYDDNVVLTAIPF